MIRGRPVGYRDARLGALRDGRRTVLVTAHRRESWGAPLERVAREVLIPQGYGIDWSGISYQERLVGSQSVYAFAFGLLMVKETFPLLGTLCEPITFPSTDRLTLPVALPDFAVTVTVTPAFAG